MLHQQLLHTLAEEKLKNQLLTEALLKSERNLELQKQIH